MLNTQRTNEHLFSQSRRAVSQLQHAQLVNKLSHVPSILDLCDVVKEQAYQWGFSDFIYHPIDLGNGFDRGVLCTLSDEYKINYHVGKFFEIDELVNYVLFNNLPIMLSTIANHMQKSPYMTDTISRNKDLFSFNNRHGFADWYVIPLKNKNAAIPRLFAVSIKHDSDNQIQGKVDNSREQLLAFAESLDCVCCDEHKIYYDGHRDSTLLNTQPLLLLRTLANGATSLKDAARKMGISIDTANVHIRNAREKLGATSTFNAIFIATQLGIID